VGLDVKLVEETLEPSKSYTLKGWWVGVDKRFGSQLIRLILAIKIPVPHKMNK